jgi:hypothetical protein
LLADFIQARDLQTNLRIILDTTIKTPGSEYQSDLVS